MTVEADIYTALKTLVANRVFPDMAPLTTTKPYITYSQIGGESVSFLDNSVSSRQNGRFQFNIWGESRASCSALMLLVESALVASTVFQAKPVSAPASTYDNDMFIYGSMQDFSIWSNR